MTLQISSCYFPTFYSEFYNLLNKMMFTREILYRAILYRHFR